jgi:CRISPR-associated exonuclease Cas4
MLTGTVVNYYTHCRRQCWLFYHQINLEDNSEDVHRQINAAHTGAV